MQAAGMDWQSRDDERGREKNVALWYNAPRSPLPWWCHCLIWPETKQFFSYCHLISSHLIITWHGTFRHAGRKDTGNCTTKPRSSLPSSQPPSQAHNQETSDRATPSHCRTCRPIDGKLEINKHPLILPTTVNRNSIKDFKNSMCPLCDCGNRLSTLYQLLKEINVIKLAIHTGEIRFIPNDSCHHIFPSMYQQCWWLASQHGMFWWLHRNSAEMAFAALSFKSRSSKLSPLKPLYCEHVAQQ